MRKIVLWVLFAWGFFANMLAQEASILDVNKSKAVNLVVDFSNASIHNLSEEEFSTYEPDFLSKRPEVISKLAEEFNDSKKVDFLLGKFPKATYTIKINIVSVSVKGNVTSSADILDADGTVIATVPEIQGDGGTFGSKMNLMGDGFKSTGKALAKQLAKMIKVEAKKTKR